VTIWIRWLSRNPLWVPIAAVGVAVASAAPADADCAESLPVVSIVELSAARSEGLADAASYEDLEVEVSPVSCVEDPAQVCGTMLVARSSTGETVYRATFGGRR
jgi:hypothetical protein